MAICWMLRSVQSRMLVHDAVSSDADADDTVSLASLPYGMRLPWGNPLTQSPKPPASRPPLLSSCPRPGPGQLQGQGGIPQTRAADSIARACNDGVMPSTVKRYEPDPSGSMHYGR